VSFDARLRRRLKLRDLDTLMVVARTQSMAKAAIELSMSQPAVSKAIADMEHTLGVCLLDRTSQGVEPTLYGHVVLKWANAIFDDLRQSVKEIEFVADPTAGELRIGVPEPLVAGLLPAIMEQLEQKYPRISFQITQALSPQLPKELRNRTVDLLLTRVELPLQDADLEAEILFNEPVFVAAALTNPWCARRGPIRLCELMEEPWSLPRPDSMGGTIVAEIFRASGLEPPRARVSGNSIQMHMALLATGRYMTVFPRSVICFAADRYSIRTTSRKAAQNAPSNWNRDAAKSNEESGHANFHQLRAPSH
jgi:DNA-binding transcriptional LysR family regulator